MSFWGILFLLLYLPALFSLDPKPWVGQIWEWQLSPRYGTGYYPRIDRADHSHSSYDQWIVASLSFSPQEKWQGEWEMEWAQTSLLSWGMRSTAVDIRFLWTDELVDAPVSTTSGIAFRYVPSRSLRDPSTPYQNMYNIILNQSLGKEWSVGPYFVYRIFGQLAIELPTQGSPALAFLLAFQTNWEDRHRIQCNMRSGMGLGTQKTVHVYSFHGYRNIAYRNIDVQLGYEYLFVVWGSLRFDVGYRLLARSFPERFTFVELTYSLPFSFF